MKKINLVSWVNPTNGPTVCRRSTDGQSLRHYSVGLTKLLFTLSLLTLGVGQMWATDYYYRGDRNSWGATKMTQSEDGYYYYYECAAGDAHKFKIATSTSSWDYNWSYVSAGFNGTGSNIGDYGKDNCYCWESGKHYIIIYPGDFYNFLRGNPKICASTSLPKNDWYIKHDWNNAGWSWQKFTKPASGSNYTYEGKRGANDDVCNINTGSTDSNCGTIAVASISGYSSFVQGDNVIFTYNPTINSLSVSDKTYTVSVVSGGNGTVSTSSVTAGKYTTSASVTATPSTGYHFVNWTATSGVTITSPDATSTTVKATGASKTLTANFAANTYTITFDGNGGSDGGATATYDNSTLTSITHSTRASYDLDGYFTATSGGTKVVNADGTLVASAGSYTNASSEWVYDNDVELHAQWTYNPVTYLLKFGKHYGSEAECTVTAKDDEDNSLTSNTSYASGTVVTVTASCDDEDYKLGGWYNAWTGGSLIAAAGTTNPYTFTLSAATSIYAHYVRKTTSITLNKGIGSGGTAGPVTATHGNTTLSTNPLVCPAKSGYTFTGYWTESSGGTKVIGADGTLIASVDGYTKSGNKKWDYEGTTLTLYAQYSENMTDVTLAASPAGSGTFTIGGAAATSTTAGRTTTRSVTAVPGNGYYLSGTIWSKSNENITLSSTTTNPTTVTGCGTASTSSTLTATFKPKWYLKGAFNSWGTTHPFVFTSSTSGYVDVELDANSTFKLYDDENSQWYGSEYGIEKGVRLSTELWSDNANNCPITINGLAGTYRFTLDLTSGKVVTVTPPTFNQIRFYTARTDGDLTNTYDFENTGSSTWTKSINLTAGTTYWFKVLEDGTYLGNDGTMTRANRTNWTMSDANNCGITADVTGSYTFSYVPSTNKLTVAYPTAYTITYGVGDVKGTSSVSVSPSFTSGAYVLPETDVTFSKGSTKNGYTWKGWYSDQAGSATCHSSTDANYTWSATRTGNISVYACYTLNNYTITYNLNGGSNPVSPAPATAFNVESSTITLPTPTKTGYTFGGWYTNSSLTGDAVTQITTGSYGNKAYWAKWTPITYTIHFNGNGNTSGSMSDQTGVTYDAATTITANAFAKTGYNFGGWATTQERANAGTVDRADGAAHGNLTSTQGATAQLWAVWTAKTTTISYSQSGTGYGSGGQSTPQTATYDAAMPTPITTPTAANGYAFMGYYDVLSPLGTQYYNADGTSANTWDKEDAAVTLYAYFKKAEITALTLDAAQVAPEETIGVTPTISPNPTGTTTICWEVRYADSDNPLSPQPAMTWDDGKLTFAASETSGLYKIVATLKTGNDCAAGTTLSTTSVNVQVAGSHTVTVAYKYSSTTIKASTSVTARPLVWSDEITAPDIFGYTFSNWTAVDGVTIKDSENEDVTSSTEATIKIKATYNGTLTANYTPKNIVYFKDNLGWTDSEDADAHIYVNLLTDDYWNDANGSGNNGVTNRNLQMDRVPGTTDIFYYDYGNKTTSNFISFTKESMATYENFHQAAPDYAHVVFPSRTLDALGTNNATGLGFYAATPMFVPLATQTPVKKNSDRAAYYNDGYWTKYLPGTGYTLQIYNAAGNSLEKEIAFTSADELMPMKVVTDLEGGHTYKFQLKRDGDVYYGNNGTMTYADHGQNTAWDFYNNSPFNMCTIVTNAAGDYTFNLSYSPNSGGTNNRLRISVDYPVASGDYRLVYTDDVHTNIHPSAIVNKVNNGTDIVSFFVREDETPVVRIQQATVNPSTGAITWNEYPTTGTPINQITGAIASAITKDAVYNFYLSMNGSGELSVDSAKLYTGNYYIRTDAANSKWDNYRTDPDHLMTYSDYLKSDVGYTHYYTHWVNKDDVGRKNVKFVIANDYSPCISDTLARETATGMWAHIGDWMEEGGDLKRSANVRFMWDEETNAISRAYVDGAQEDGSEFLLLLSSDSKIKQGETVKTQITFSDNGNWIYEANVKAQTEAQYKLKSTWGDTGNAIVQYFKGSSSETETLIGGSGDDWYDIRLIYDFKTNRLVASYVPATGTINTEIPINADVMFIREHQGDIAQLTFGGSGAISEIKTAYGVLRLNKWTLNNKDKSTHNPLAQELTRYERDLFYISFPFRVNLEEVFGFGTYGTHWIIEEYDGAGRAANGFWADTPTFWRFITNRKGKFLEPNTGYIVAVDLDELGETSSVWANTDQVELYFPSYGSMPDIKSSSVTYEVPAHTCTINRGTEQGDRRIKDSHWNVISVPTYINTSNVTFANTDWITAGDGKLGPSFLYTVNWIDNSLTPTTGAGYTYKAMHAYIVQYKDNITWTTSVSPASIVARRTYEEAPENIEFRIELSQNEQTIDQTFVRLTNDENVTSGFEFNYDLSKEFNKNKANIYTMVSTMIDDDLSITETAGNCLPMTEQTTIVPMGIQIAKAGEYTISIPSGTNGVGVTLIDNETGLRTNLALEDYRVELDAATYDSRFIIEISPIVGVWTDVEQTAVSDQPSDVRKVIIDQKMYIIKDGKVYDAQGARVR